MAVCTIFYKNSIPYSVRRNSNKIVRTEGIRWDHETNGNGKLNAAYMYEQVSATRRMSLNCVLYDRRQTTKQQHLLEKRPPRVVSKWTLFSKEMLLQRSNAVVCAGGTTVRSCSWCLHAVCNNVSSDFLFLFLAYSLATTRPNARPHYCTVQVVRLEEIV